MMKASVKSQQNLLEEALAEVEQVLLLLHLLG
jgi:hypothetical protein